MGNWLFDHLAKHTKTVHQIGLEPGDFIKAGRYNYWREVETTFSEESCAAHSRRGTEYIFYHDIDFIHRHNDPWNYKECFYGIADNSGFHRSEIPKRYLYQGTYTVKIWGYKWNNFVVKPKVKVPFLENFAEKCGITTLSGIPWDKVSEVKKSIEGIQIKRWRVLVEPVPDTIYDLTINVRDLISKTAEDQHDFRNPQGGCRCSYAS